ncbi:hypothetical protein VC83_01275 [Pseudogymnoascus destructans]|uniref:Uncharacterized protein n=1 Tax=Pseudogymnoascus destructans TaxID=655981 RepID=A0A177AK31_9PEZI|nr:uncharacterized protein VC83_01275 [Pseudogymnoascus destructans]OAF62418.1 hypothetical protein VC83_01275 [Pseudogymnoascus destructans]
MPHPYTSQHNPAAPPTFKSRIHLSGNSVFSAHMVIHIRHSLSVAAVSFVRGPSSRIDWVDSKLCLWESWDCVEMIDAVGVAGTGRLLDSFEEEGDSINSDSINSDSINSDSIDSDSIDIDILDIESSNTNNDVPTT